MAKKINAKDERISVRCSQRTFTDMKIVALRLGLSDGEVIEYAIQLLLAKSNAEA